MGFPCSTAPPAGDSREVAASPYVPARPPAMTQPYVSIGLPVYNGERFLSEALDSFLGQTFTDFEIVISDNASTDRTGAIARAYVARDSRIRYHRNERNIGLGRNHNRVFHLARGRYFKWAAADDVCLPEYLQRCVDVLDADPTVVLTYPATQFVDDRGKPLDIEDPGWDLREDNPAERFRYVLLSMHWVNSIIGLIRTSALAKTRLMPDYPSGDYRVLGELSLLGKFYEIPERLFVRRLHKDSSSQHGEEGATPDKQWLVRYWKGSAKSLTLPMISLKFDHFRTVIGSALPMRKKLSLLSAWLRTVVGGRKMLLDEFCSATTRYLLG